MSTILNALKKVESEKGNANSFDPALVAGFHSQQAMQRAAKLAWLKRRSVLWGAVGGAAMLLAVGIYAFSGSGQQGNGAQAKTSVSAADRSPVGQRENNAAEKHGMQKRAGISSPLPDQNTSSSKQVVSVPPSAGLDREKVLRMMASKPAPSSIGQVPVTATATPVTKPQEKTQPITPVDQRAVTEQMMTRKTSPSVSEKQKERKVQSLPKTSDKVKSHGNENEEYANAERLTDGRLKVQAIVYADISDERMAVVNNQIVREGSTIEGFSIIGIGESALYVKEGGRLLKVQFGTP